MHIEKDVSDVLVHGTTNLTTANVPAQVCGSTVKPLKGIQLRAGIDNGGTIYVGNIGAGNVITAAGCGFPMEAGDQLFLPVENPCAVYANNATANDVIHWIML